MSSGTAAVTRPAPVRCAARHTSAGAPAMPREPPTTRRRPYVPLWDSAARRGKRAATSRTATASRAAPSVGSTNPRSATAIRPQRAAGAWATWQGFGHPNVTVRSARTDGIQASASSAERPEGRSTETTKARPDEARAMARAGRPSGATRRFRPVPKSASTISVATASGSSSRGSFTSRIAPPTCSRRWYVFRASGVRCCGLPRSSVSTPEARRPAMRRRATSKPSPPLLPGPARTTTRAPRAGRLARTPAISRTTAFAARFIRTRPGVPEAIVLTSRARASSAETTLMGRSAREGPRRPDAWKNKKENSDS